MCNLHSQVDEEGLETRVQYTGCTTRICRMLHQKPGSRGLGLLARHYDDGGYTGGNMERPALKRLLADIEAVCKCDCVVVYKSRSPQPIADGLCQDVRGLRTKSESPLSA